MKNFIFSLLIAFLITSCGEKHQPTFTGKWYATQYGCRTVVVFNPDSTISIKSEANANTNMTVHYIATQMGDHYNFDLDNKQMDNRGIAIFNGTDCLQIAIVFGPEQYVPRPKKYEDARMAQGNLMLTLYRDSTLVASALDCKIEAPAEAQLAFERNKRLGRGLCMNGYVDANPVDGNDAPMTEADFTAIREAGFQSVRIPTTWVAHCSKEAPYTIDDDFFRKMDWTIEQCIKNGLVCTIDQHYYPYINMSDDDPNLNWEQNLDRIKSLWRQIAERYKDISNDMLYFDLLNEPNNRLGADGLNKLHAELIAIIRQTNPGRTLLVGTPNLGQSWTLGELTFPEGEWNIIAQAHVYTPYLFTHQNLEHVPSAMTGCLVEWHGTPEECASIQSDLDFCQLWSQKQGRPVNIGEYGVCLKADQPSINRYLSFMQKQFNLRGLSNHIWAYRGLFGLCDLQTKEWNAESIAALTGK